METRPGPSKRYSPASRSGLESILPGGRLTSRWPPSWEGFRLMCAASFSHSLCAVLGISSAFPLLSFKEKKPCLQVGGRGSAELALKDAVIGRWGRFFVWTGSFSVSCVWEVKGLTEDRGKLWVPAVWSDLAWSACYTCQKLASKSCLDLRELGTDWWSHTCTKIFMCCFDEWI